MRDLFGNLIKARRGLNDQEIAALKEAVAGAGLGSVSVNKQRYAYKTVNIRPGKIRGYLWNEREFNEVLTIAQRMGLLVEHFEFPYAVYRQGLHFIGIGIK